MLKPLLRKCEALAASWPKAYRLALRWMTRHSPIKLISIDLIRQGDVVFDVGANRGILTSLFSNLVGPAGHVHAFEPSPQTCQMLRASLAGRSRHDNVKVNTCAVGESAGEMLLHTPGTDDGQASLAVHSTGSWSADGVATRSQPCAVIRLDDYVRDHEITRIDFVKIDVEGAERLAVRGFADALRRLRPVVLAEQCSLWSRDFGYRPSELIDDVRRLGYDQSFLLIDGGVLSPINDPKTLDRSSESFDVVFFSAVHHGERLRRARLAINSRKGTDRASP